MQVQLQHICPDCFCELFNLYQGSPSGHAFSRMNSLQQHALQHKHRTSTVTPSLPFKCPGRQQEAILEHARAAADVGGGAERHVSRMYSLSSFLTAGAFLEGCCKLYRSPQHGKSHLFSMLHLDSASCHAICETKLTPLAVDSPRFEMIRVYCLLRCCGLDGAAVGLSTCQLHSVRKVA